MNTSLKIFRETNDKTMQSALWKSTTKRDHEKKKKRKKIVKSTVYFTSLAS